VEFYFSHIRLSYLEVIGHWLDEYFTIPSNLASLLSFVDCLCESSRRRRNDCVSPLKTFIRKHVINKAVINYAGEGYFVMQLAKLKGLNLSRATIIVKNLNLARTFVANFWILFLVLATVIFGNSSLLQ